MIKIFNGQGPPIIYNCNGLLKDFCYNEFKLLSAQMGGKKKWTAKGSGCTLAMQGGPVDASSLQLDFPTGHEISKSDNQVLMAFLMTRFISFY